MRKSASAISTAFLNGYRLRMGEALADNGELSYRGNVIARRNLLGGFEVNTQGWNTPTTFRYLNALPGVNFQTKKYTAYLNGKVYEGGWVTISIF